SPIPDASRALPLRPPPLMREHRLYQADWLMRFYGFEVGEVAPPGNDGMLDLDIDPKLAWALRNRAQFPVELDTAPREQLLRVPGPGAGAGRGAGRPAARRGGPVRRAGRRRCAPASAHRHAARAARVPRPRRAGAGPRRPAAARGALPDAVAPGARRARAAGH